MKTQNKKTDESVKAGLQIETDTRPQTNETGATADEDIFEEKDADEKVHEPKEEVPDVSIEHDLDEVVHEQTGGITTAGDVGEKDIDDFMHQQGK